MCSFLGCISPSFVNRVKNTWYRVVRKRVMSQSEGERDDMGAFISISLYTSYHQA